MTEQGGQTGNKGDGENRERRAGVVYRTLFPAAEFATGLFRRHDRVNGTVPLARQILNRYQTSVRESGMPGLPLVQGRPVERERAGGHLDSKGPSGPGQRGTGTKVLEKPVQRLTGPDAPVMKRSGVATAMDVKIPSAPLKETRGAYGTGDIPQEPLLKKNGDELSTSPDPAKASVAEWRTESRIADDCSVMAEPLVAQPREDGVFSSKTGPKAGRAFARRHLAGESPPYDYRPSTVKNPAMVLRKTDGGSSARESGQEPGTTAAPPSVQPAERITAPVRAVRVRVGAGHARDQGRHHSGHVPLLKGLPMFTGNGRGQAGTVKTLSAARPLVQARTDRKDSGMKNLKHGLTTDSLGLKGPQVDFDPVAVPNVPVQRMADKTVGPISPMLASPMFRRQSLICPSAVVNVQAQFQPMDQSGLERMTPEIPESQTLVKVNPKLTGEPVQALGQNPGPMPQGQNMPLGMSRTRMMEQVVRRVEDRLNRREDDVVRGDTGHSNPSSRPSATPSPETSGSDEAVRPGTDIAALADQVYSLILERLTIEKESLGL